MTDEQIFELVKEHFTEEWCEEDGNGWVEFSGKPSDFVEFARAIRQDGYTEGYDDGMCEANYSNPLQGIFSSNED